MRSRGVAILNYARSERVDMPENVAASLVHVSMVGLSNHELRTVLVAFWWTLDPDDRADFASELSYYLERDGEGMPPLAQLIVRAVDRELGRNGWPP